MTHRLCCMTALLLATLGAQASPQPQGLTSSLAPAAPQCTARLQQEGGQQARTALERKDYETVSRAIRDLESCTLAQRLLATPQNR